MNEIKNETKSTALQTPATKYEVFTAQRVKDTITHPMIAGAGLLYEGNTHFVLRIMMFPGTSYYMVKNRDSSTNFTIFSKCIRADQGIKFQNPVGIAKLSEELKTHLEIKFHLLSQSLYMNLYPAHS